MGGVMLKPVTVSTFLFVLVFTAPAQALTGNDLYDDCKSTNAGKQMDCLGYITGVVEMILYAKRSYKICMADIPAGVSRGQVNDIVVSHLEKHPAVRHHDAVALAIDALDIAFPCP